jgi:hypothetical protein
MRMMRLMTHLNIGAMLGMFAWLIWSGWQAATGQFVMHRRDLQVHSEPQPMQLLPVSTAERSVGHCLPPSATAQQLPGGPVSGADL